MKQVIEHERIQRREERHTARPASNRVERLETILVLAAISVLALGAYWPCLNIGFLLDDFQHVDYVSRAFQGDVQDLLDRTFRNWSGRTDSMTSYRPLICLSFCLDSLLHGINAVGYHFSNLIAFVGCCVLLALIALDLEAARSRSIALISAAIAGTLFAVYPVHPEAVAWVIGRVDVLCGLFYFGSLYCYMRFRRTGKKTWLVRSLAAGLFALASKEMAVTLPAVIASAEMLLARPLGWSTASRKSASFLPAVSSFYWADSPLSERFRSARWWAAMEHLT